MKDPINDFGRNQDLDPEDMSLTDLLGSDAASAQSSPDEDLARVNERKDEPDSGVVALAHMVATSSVKTAQTPSIAPPPYKGPRSMAPGPTSTAPPPPTSLAPPPPDPFAPPPLDAPSFGAPTFEPVSPAPAPAKKKSIIPIFVIVVAIAAGVGGGYYYINQQEQESINEEAEQAELARKIAALRAKQEAEMGRTGQPEPGSEAAGPKTGEPEVATAERVASDDQNNDRVDTQALEAASIGRRDKKSKRRTSTRSGRRSGTRSNKADTKAAAKNPQTRDKKSSIFASSKSRTRDSDLDSLLGPSRPREPRPKAKGQKPSSKSQPAMGGLPAKPSKASVRKVMGKVSSQASQACAIYATGTVQLQIVVGSNGAVTTARPLGSFANSNAGKCAAMMAKKAKFPAFSDPTFRFKYPIIIR